MYRIMVVKSKRENYGSLYQYLTTTIDGVTMPVEIKSKEELDVKVEKMLNVEGYSKDDFIVVQVVDYNIDVDIVPSSCDNANSTIQTDWLQNDSESPDYIKNRPFYKEQTAVDYVTLYASNMDADLQMGFYGKRIGLSVGQTYSVDIVSDTGETTTVDCECVDGAGDIGLPDAVIPILVSDREDIVIYDGVSIDAEGNPAVSDNAVYVLGDNITSIIVHGLESIAEVIHKISNAFLDVDNTFDANSPNPQSGKAINGAIHSALNQFIVGTEQIEDSSIIEDKLANNSVSASKIQSKSITNALIADKTIKGEKIEDSEITERIICKGAVTSDKLASGCVKGKNLEKPTLLEDITVSEPVVNVCCTKVNMWDGVNIRCAIRSTSASQQVLLITTNSFSTSGGDVLAKIPLDFSKVDCWQLNINVTKDFPAVAGMAYYIGAECSIWGYDKSYNYMRDYYDFGRVDTGGNMAAIYFRFGDVDTQKIAVGSNFKFIGTRSK